MRLLRIDIYTVTIETQKYISRKKRHPFIDS